jgi:hypothetical protein
MFGDRKLQSYLARLPVDEAAAWKRKLERHRADCGCQVGALVTLLLVATWIAFSYLMPAAGHTWPDALIRGTIVVSVSALIGKLLGLIIARIRFNLTARSLQLRACGGVTGAT